MRVWGLGYLRFYDRAHPSRNKFLDVISTLAVFCLTPELLLLSHSSQHDDNFQQLSWRPAGV